MRRSWAWFCLLSAVTTVTCFGQGNLADRAVHFGMCDASAAVAVDPEMFLVANDEDNTLRLYHRDRGGESLGAYHLSQFLRTESEHPETDIEAAAGLGDMTFWITSHGRNKNGKPRPNRYRLFATRVRRDGGKITVTGAGTPYVRLLADMLSHESLKPYGLAQASRRAPKDKDALNIEGLAATPRGTLLIGFRNPIRRGKALLVPLENPRQVIRGAAARLGAPMELDLNGLGVRSLEYHAPTGSYFVIGGPYDGRRSCQLWRWSGRREDSPKPQRRVDFGAWSPEALILYTDRPNVAQVLSDDGTKQVDGVDCKALPSDRAKNFRSGWIRLD